MRITSGGEIGIGTTSVSAKVQIHSTNAGQPTIPLFIVNKSTTLNTEARLGFAAHTNDDVGTNRYSYISTINTSGSNGQDMIFATNETGASAVERMRIESGGKVIVGTNSSNALEVFSSGDTEIGFSYQTHGNVYAKIIGDITTASPLGGEIAFQTATGGTLTERMRITAAGTIKAPHLNAYTPTGADLRYDTSDGEIYYQASSIRYKTDIVNLESSLDKINTLRPVRYNDIKTGQPACGLIAEETFDIIPEVVFTKEIEGFDEPQVEGLNYSDLVPFLIKSIQELKAEIETLKTQINN